MTLAVKDYSNKKLRLNSIKHPEVKRILKPCEARAGHGSIALIIQIAILAGIIALAVKLVRWILS